MKVFVYLGWSGTIKLDNNNSLNRVFPWFCIMTIAEILPLSVDSC